MIQKQITIQLEEGLQSRPAAQFVQLASTFQSDIMIVKEEKKLAAKSIMGVMAAALRKGDQVLLTASGSDEEKAIDALEKFLLELENANALR